MGANPARAASADGAKRQRPRPPAPFDERDDRRRETRIPDLRFDARLLDDAQRNSPALNEGELTPEEAATAKWWCTDLQGRVVDRCLQLFGGYGYCTEYPIAQLYMDARVAKIYGGSNETLKDVIARSM